MEHRPYPRIEAHAPAASGARWVATEKVHGANLVVATDGGRVRIGKRKAWLSDDEPFFGWQLLRASLEHAAMHVWRSLDAPRSIRLHGELYGGHYPHPDVAPCAGFSPVQSGVWYAPDVRVAVFDIQIDRGDAPLFLSHRDVEALSTDAGFETVPVLGRGSKATLDLLPVRFVTRVPSMLGLPPIADNVAEGYVIKPDAESRVDARPAVKRKIPEFDEGRFDDGAAWDPRVTVSPSVLCARAVSLINLARLASARSKVGPHDREALYEEAALDAMIDLERAFPTAVRALSQEELEGLHATLIRSARALDPLENPRR